MKKLLDMLRKFELAANTVIGCYERNPGNFALALKLLEEAAQQTRELLASQVETPSNGPTEYQVYQWFQEATINHHIQEDGRHIAKRALFVAQKAWDAALGSVAVPQQVGGEPQCRTCNGSGEVTARKQIDVDRFDEWQETCPVCNGNGFAEKHVQELQERYEKCCTELHALQCQVGAERLFANLHLPQAAIPDGWKLVPIKPTIEMLHAMLSSKWGPKNYAAMLSNTPLPPLVPKQKPIPDVDELAAIIRKVDGAHSLGASALAEAIISELSAAPSLPVEPLVPKQQPVPDEIIKSFSLMTSLVRLKYGNLDAEIYAEIEKAEALIASTEEGK